MMVLKADQQRVKALLAETVTLLCKNGLHFKSELCIEGLIGITLDQEDIFLVNIRETVKLNKPAADLESVRNPVPVEQSTTAKKNRHRPTTVESTQVTDSVLPSVKSASITTADESLASSNDNPATSDHRSCSPEQPSSVKSQLEDVVNRPTTPLPSSGRTQETGVSERPVSFCDVPIKLDYALGSGSAGDGDSRPSESHPSEPARKRLRRQQPSQAVENSQEPSNLEPPTFETPSHSSSCKLEPSDIIEIKEESLSDEEMRDSMAGYSSYADYSATAAYGNSDLDVSQMYGESSSFQAETMFHGELQGNLSSRSHESRMDPAADLLYGDQGNCPQCPYCQKTFSTAAVVKAHIKKIHRKEYPYICTLCNKGVAGLTDLEGHMASRHDMPKGHQCPLCLKQYAYKSKLKLHMRLKHGIFNA